MNFATDIKLNKNRKFSEEEFSNLPYIEEDDLKAGKPIVTRYAESGWYVLYDTPEGKYVTVMTRDLGGIRETICFQIKYIHHHFKLAPVTKH